MLADVHELINSLLFLFDCIWMLWLDFLSHIWSVEAGNKELHTNINRGIVEAHYINFKLPAFYKDEPKTII